MRTEMDKEMEELLPRRANDSPGSRWKFGCFLLLVSVFYERMAYYSLISNLINFLMGYPYDWTSYNSNMATFFFEFASSFFAVFGALLADAYLGQVKVMVIGYLIYFAFYFPLPFLYLFTWDGVHWNKTAQPICASNHNISMFSPHDSRCHKEQRDESLFNETCASLVMTSLLLVGVGSAFIRSVVTPYGAEQIQQHPDKTRRFFSWYYWSLNTGMIMAYLIPDYVQVNLSMFWGYMSPCIVLFLSFLTFLYSVRMLKQTQPAGSSLGSMVGAMKEAIGRGSCVGGQIGSLEESEVEDLGRSLPPKCLDVSKETLGGSYSVELVEETKKFLCVLFVFVPIIFFWACWFQVRTYFLTQGLHMKVPELMQKHRIPVTWLEMIDSYAIFMLLPFLDRIVYPWLQKRNISFSLYRRMGLGMIFSTLAMVAAGVLERQRMQTFWGFNNTSAYVPEGRVNQTIVGTVFFAADMDIFYQTPQYILLGIGEALTNVAGIEFAYHVAPPRIQSLLTGCYWLFASLGSLLGMGLAQAVRERLIFSDHCFDINYRKPCPDSTDFCAETRLDYYFYILAGVQLFGFFILFLITRMLKMKDSGNTRDINALVSRV